MILSKGEENKLISSYSIATPAKVKADVMG